MPHSLPPLALIGATAVTPFHRVADCTLLLAGGKIVQMGPKQEVNLPAGVRRIDAEGCYILPGFIDVHVHGGVGADFTDEDPAVYDRICRFHARHGTTSLLATIYPQAADRFTACIRRLRYFCEAAGPDRILEGIHLEGPFLNPNRHGAIPPEHLWPATVEGFDRLVDLGGPWIRVMTLAPEIPGGMEVLRAAAIRENPDDRHHRPLHLSLGHSDARYEQIAEAIANGLEGVTHIFNAMTPMHHRKPGVLAGALLRDELFVEAIADAVHVHPAMMQLLLKIKGHDRILLVTDAIRAAGQPDGTYDLAGQQVIVRDRLAYLAEHPDTLAGSTQTMDRSLRMMVHYVGATLEQAAQMASLNAARILEWKYRRGILAVGKDADLVVLTGDLQVRQTIKAGHIVYDAAAEPGL